MEYTIQSGLKSDKCPKCNFDAVLVDLEYQKKEQNRFYKEVYDMKYCERCDKVFINKVDKI